MRSAFVTATHELQRLRIRKQLGFNSCESQQIHNRSGREVGKFERVAVQVAHAERHYRFAARADGFFFACA